MTFRLELVGGPFDALAGLYLRCEPFELPTSVRVGYCRGAGQCATDACPDRRHPAYWLEVESDYMPPDTVPYERQVVDVEAGRAVYAIGGLLPVDSAVAGDELPMVEQEHPLVTARVPDTAAGLLDAIERARREWLPSPARALPIWGDEYTRQLDELLRQFPVRKPDVRPIVDLLVT